jgi:SAM-dependent methyltransferase
MSKSHTLNLPKSGRREYTESSGDRWDIESVRDHWDSVADIYDDSNAHIVNPHEWRFIECMKHIRKSQDPHTILNIWSRTGDAIPFIRSVLPNSDIWNFELSKKMLKMSKNKYPEEKFYSTDLKGISAPDEFFDYVVSLETLEHAPNPPLFIIEMHRILRPGGTLIMSLPPRIADFHQWIYEKTVGGHGEGPRRGIPSRNVKKLLSAEGFRLEIHKSILLIPIGPDFLINFGNWLTENIPLLREFGVMQFYICRK